MQTADSQIPSLHSGGFIIIIIIIIIGLLHVKQHVA